MPQTNAPTSAYAKKPEADGKYLVTLGEFGRCDNTANVHSLTMDALLSC